MAQSGEVVEDLALLTASWRSIGLRGATVEWELGRPARLTGSLASRLRSALGPALAGAGARAATLQSIPGDSAPPALWFLGWDCPPRPVLRLSAELRCVGAVAADWPELARALARVRLPAAGDLDALADARRCSVTWHGQGQRTAARGEFGPPLVAEPDLDIAGGACLVEALAPLQLRAAGRDVTGPPPLDVLVRSAGERLRQLASQWGAEPPALRSVVGRAVLEAREARLSWARAASDGFERRSSRTGQRQVVRGVRGVFAYEGVTPLAMTVLALGAEVGAGKDTSFGCGWYRVHGARVG